MSPPRFLNRHTPPHIATLVLMTGIGALSMNIFLPSLPGMARDFGVDYSVMQLSVSAYLAVCAAAQLVIGPLSDRIGRRPMILGGLSVFLLATLGTLLAPTAGVFLAFRMMQAAVVTGIVLSRAVVRDMVPGPQAASMIGYVTMGMSLAPMLGPIAGGALDDAFGWRANFVALGIAGLLVLALVWADLGETGKPGEGGGSLPLRNWLELLASRRFWGYALAATASSGGFFAYVGGAPFVGAEVFHLSPSAVGYYFAAPAIGYAFGNLLSGRYSVRSGMERMVLAGAVVSTLALVAALALDLAGISHPLIFFPLVGVMALGNGMLLPNANAGMMSVRPELAGTASGLGGTMTIGGGAALAALAGALLSAERGATPLLALMLAASAGSIPAILWVMRRRASLAL